MDIATEIARFSERRNNQPPRHLGQRYDASGFLPEAGNTVVCALDTSDPAHGAVLSARDRIMALLGAERILFTPANSLHMTVFEGAIETRRTPDAWPADMDRAAPMGLVTQAIEGRLATFQPPPPFAVRVAGIGPGGLKLTGATTQDNAHLALWREALTAPFGYRHGNHDAYRFHMTFGYPVDWLSDAQVAAWNAELPAILTDLQEGAPILPLGPPAFCEFADMKRFVPRRVLGG